MDGKITVKARSVEDSSVAISVEASIRNVAIEDKLALVKAFTAVLEIDPTDLALMAFAFMTIDIEAHPSTHVFSSERKMDEFIERGRGGVN